LQIRSHLTSKFFYAATSETLIFFVRLEKLLKDCDTLVPNLLARNLALSVAREVDIMKEANETEIEKNDVSLKDRLSESVGEIYGDPTMVKERTALLIDSVASSGIARELVALWFSIRSRNGTSPFVTTKLLPMSLLLLTI
jgi:hypothetical protein